MSKPLSQIDLLSLPREEALRIAVEASNQLRRDGRSYIVLVGEFAGYAAAPGTGPKGESRRTCKHAVARRYAETYWKCALMRAGWTGGARTDIKLKSPACEKWTAKEI